MRVCGLVDEQIKGLRAVPTVTGGGLLTAGQRSRDTLVIDQWWVFNLLQRM